MDHDPWRHVPPLDAGSPRHRALPNWAVSALLLISMTLLALMPIVIVVVVLIAS
jgi:hypothetical protein